MYKILQKIDIILTKTGILKPVNKDKIDCQTWLFHTFIGSAKSEASTISPSSSNRSVGYIFFDVSSQQKDAFQSVSQTYNIIPFSFLNKLLDTIPNKNTNGLIRQHFPKSSSFENLTYRQVTYTQNKLNNRPRKKLGFLSPKEYFLANFETNHVAFMT